MLHRGITAAGRLGWATLLVLTVGALAPGGGAAASTHAVSTTSTSTTTSSTPAAPAPPAPPAPGGAFSWFVPGPAPANFRSFAVGGAVVADPPRLKPLGGSGGSLSFAARGSHGAYFAFLNVTPKQGTESLAGWAAFRLAALRAGGGQSIHEDAASGTLAFRGGSGACVIDDYVTRVAANPFHEIACLVQGSHTASVLVVATPPADWHSYAVPLERVVSSYRVT